MAAILARVAVGSAVALILGSAGLAQDPNGYVGVGVSHTELDAAGPNDDFEGYLLEGAYHNELANGLDLQANVTFDYFDTDPDSIDVWSGELHLFNRKEGHAAGAFLSVADSDSADSLWGIGAEGALYRDQLTFSGAAGWFDGDTVDTIYGGCAAVRLYGSDNFSVEGRGALVDVDYGGGADTSAYGLGAGAEYQLMGSPFSIGGDVGYTDLDDFNLEATTVMLRGRFNIGTSDLKQRDRRGASMPGASCILDVANF